MSARVRWFSIVFAVLMVLLIALSLSAPPATIEAAKPPTRTPTPTATPCVSCPTPTPIPPTPTPLPPTATPTTAPPTPTAVPGTTLQVHFINVGQGNSALVVAPSGKTMLVDSGELVQSGKVASYLLSVLGTKTIDYFVVTHYHSDHFGSYTDLLRNQGVSVTTATYDRGGDRTEYNSPIYTDYYDFCTTQNPTACKRTTLHENDLINLGAGITAKVLCMGSVSPRIAACGQTYLSENDNSALILVTMGSMDVWLGGDTSGDSSHTYYADVETAAVSQGKIGSYLDVYGVDHHGSCYSTNQNLVNATLPTVSVFSLGNNTYGHPCSTVVTRLTNAGSNLYYTEDSSGAIVDGDVKIVYAGGTTYTVTGAKGTRTFTTK